MLMSNDEPTSGVLLHGEQASDVVLVAEIWSGAGRLRAIQRAGRCSIETGRGGIYLRLTPEQLLDAEAGLTALPG